MTSNLQNSKSNQNKENLRNCHSPKEPREALRQNVVWYIEYNPITQKGYWGKLRKS